MLCILISIHFQVDLSYSLETYMYIYEYIPILTAALSEKQGEAAVLAH
jgi:hypothetical protein